MKITRSELKEIVKETLLEKKFNKNIFHKNIFEMLKFEGIEFHDIKSIDYNLGTIWFETHDGDKYSMSLVKI